MFSRFIIDKDGRAGRDLLVCASKPSRPRREGQRPVPYIAIPVYSGSKMFVQINYRSFFCLLFFSKKSKGVALPICPKAPDIKPVTERTASIPTWGRMSPITVMAVATDFHRDFLFDTRRVLSSTRDRPFLILFCSVMHGFSVQQYCIIAPWLCQRGGRHTG